MPIVATYEAAKWLMNELQKLGVKFKPETYSMKTSGIFIPNWEDDVPYEWDGKTAKWYFFYRFQNGHRHMNVGEAMLFAAEHGLQKLAKKINGHK